MQRSFHLVAITAIAPGTRSSLSARFGASGDSLRQLLITLPVPSVAGIQLEQLSIGADSGYVMMSGEIHGG